MDAVLSAPPAPETSSVPPQEDTAGALATRNVPVVPEHATIGHVEQLLVRSGKTFDSILYIYVVDAAGLLIGVLSVHEIFAQPKHTLVASVMRRSVIAVREDDPAETAALRALQNGIRAIPVLTKEERFLGVITGDSIMRLLHRSITEDLFQVSGLSESDDLSARLDNTTKLGLLTSMRHRLPWLVLGLLGGLLVARIVGGFEEVLQRHIVLAAYIPLIVYMASAVGMQMEALIIRDLALQPRLRFPAYFWHQLAVVTGMGVLLAAGLMGITFVLHGEVILALTISIALFAAILTSVVTGLCTPFLFGRLGCDPADASGPVATIVQDILSVLVYFFTASVLL